MNDFEHELKKQPIRPVPQHWRAQILTAAAASDAPKLERQPWWTMLLWPSPKAWGTLAAAWAFMACVSVATRDSAPTQERPEATQMRMAMEEKRVLQAEIEQASLQIDAQPKPRSERSKLTKAG